MPRKARLDAPGMLHHVIAREIGKRRIVDEDSFPRFGGPESCKIFRAVRNHPLASPRQAALFKVTCMPALVASVMSISRQNLSHLPLINSETLD
jgi:hypothetical protein